MVPLVVEMYKRVGAVVLLISCLVVVGPAPAAAQGCDVPKSVLPDWLRTNVPPGSTWSASDRPRISYGVRVNEARDDLVGERPYFLRPDFYLDGVKIAQEDLVGNVVIDLAATWHYSLSDSLSPGIHTIRLVFPSVEFPGVSGQREAVYHYEDAVVYEWSFCIT